MSKDSQSNQDLRLLVGGGSTEGAHTNGLSAGLELDLDFDAVQGVVLGQTSGELFGGGDNQRFAVGVGPRFQVGQLSLAAAPIAGYARYTLRDGCLLFCDAQRPTEDGGSAFVGGHAALTFAIPASQSRGVLIGLSGDAMRDLSEVGSEPAGWQYTWLFSAGAYFNL